MKVCKDIVGSKPKIESSIRKFGFSPEHNYYNYFYKQTPHKKCIFFDFGKNRGLMAVLNTKNSVWYVTNGILAPEGERIGIFMEFVGYALAKRKGKKIVAEFSEDFKPIVFERLKSSRYKATVNFALHWPVYCLKDWDERLHGKQWKKLRNIRNRFNSQFKVNVENPRKADKKILLDILFSWLKRRHPRDRVDYSYYLSIIENSFDGFEMARGLSFNGELCSISAGWQVPNSNCFYCGIGIFNYKHKDMGDFINLDDLSSIKSMGKKYVDLGGSDKAILKFKEKFRPEKVYKTYTFSIALKK